MTAKTNPLFSDEMIQLGPLLDGKEFLKVKLRSSELYPQIETFSAYDPRYTDNALLFIETSDIILAVAYFFEEFKRIIKTTLYIFLFV